MVNSPRIIEEIDYIPFEKLSVRDKCMLAHCGVPAFREDIETKEQLYAYIYSEVSSWMSMAKVVDYRNAARATRRISIIARKFMRPTIEVIESLTFKREKKC